jgi:hypothetical protein
MASAILLWPRRARPRNSFFQTLSKGNFWHWLTVTGEALSPESPCVVVKIVAFGTGFVAPSAPPEPQPQMI